MSDPQLLSTDPNAGMESAAPPPASGTLLSDDPHAGTPAAGQMNFAIVNGKRIDLPSDLSPDIVEGFHKLAAGDTSGSTPFSVAKDVLVGAAKGAGQTAVGLGRLYQAIPGVKPAIDAMYGTPGIADAAMNEADKDLEAHGVAENIGKGAERVAETVAGGEGVARGAAAAADMAAPTLGRVFGPTLARLLPEATVQGAGNAAIAKVQGASNKEAAATAALSAPLPAAGELAVKLADHLKDSAAENVYRFFNPTTKAWKRVVQKQTPEILDRGSEVLGTLGRNRQTALDTFAAYREDAGRAVDDALKTFGQQDVTDAPQRLIGALDLAKVPYIKPREVTAAELQSPALSKVVPSGIGEKPQYVPRYPTHEIRPGVFEVQIPLHPQKVQQIEGLKNIVRAYGPKMSVDDMVGLRRAWDEIAYQKPGTTIETVKSQASKWAKKMGGDAIRGILGTDHPDLAAINHEYSFWRDLQDAMQATVDRKVGQVGGVLAPMAEGAGAVAGAAVSGSLGQAFLVGKLAKAAQRVFASPRYHSLAANVRNNIADAIVSGNAGQARYWLDVAARAVAIEGPQAVGAATAR